MIEQAKFESILRILIRLSGPFGISIAELARDFDKSERTVRRYIQTIKDCGFVVESNQGYFKINEFEKGRKMSDLLHFSAEESELLSRAIHSIDFDGALKESLTQKLYSLYNNQLVPYAIVSAEKSENITALCEAIRQQKQVKLIDYSSANSSTISTRIVEPIDFTVNYVQLLAYEPDSDETKHFKLARIHSVEIIDIPFKYKHRHRHQFCDIFRMSGEQRHPIRLVMGMRATTLLQEEYPLAHHQLHKLNDARWVLETSVCNFEGVGRFVIGLLDDIVVEESVEFKEFIKKRLASFSI